MEWRKLICEMFSILLVLLGIFKGAWQIEVDTYLLDTLIEIDPQASLSLRAGIGIGVLLPFSA